MEKKEAIIYGVRTGDTYHYIGKTSEEVREDGKLNNSDATRQYHNTDIREIFVNNNNTEVVPLKSCAQQDWYDEKLLEVVDKYKDEHPLLNAQWMLEGKRGFWEGTQGYWQGKTRDEHTLQRLSESKYKRVVEYDINGNLVKFWKSGKAVAIQIFGDYRVTNGAGETRLYDILDSRSIGNRLRHGSYWFWEHKLIEQFGIVPPKLDIESIKAEEKRRKSARMKLLRSQRKNLGQRRYTVVHYNEDGSIKTTYENTAHAAYMLKTSVKTVMRFCTGKCYNENYILKYGEKVFQPINITYPKYKFRPLKKAKKISKAKPYVHTKTRYTVNQYKNGVVVHRFDSVEDCAKHFKLKESTVRRICRGEMKLNYNNYPVLRLGKKQKIVVG